MRQIIFISFLILQNFAIGQDCANILYSNDPLIKIIPETYIRDCYSIFSDTNYEFTPDIGTTYDTSYKLYHYKENWLIRERNTINDTAFVREYYKSGKLRTEVLYYKHRTVGFVGYFGNGQISYERGNDLDTLQVRKSYYENGTISSIKHTFKGNVYDSVVVYYPSGKISSISYFTPFKTEFLGQLYPPTKPLSKYFFNEQGDTINFDQNELKLVNEFNYPLMDTSIYASNPNVKSFYHIKGQKGYDNNMSLLKKSINQKIKFPKSFECPIAYCFLNLKIGNDGVITINEISDCRTEIKTAVEKAINKINKWEIGFVDGNPVDVILITDLKIEK